MRLRFALLMVCLALVASSAQAQFQAELNNVSQVLTNSCTGGTPIPDGATIQVWWDSTANGPDALDVLPPEGAGFQEVTFNQFLMNGEALLGTPGYFVSEYLFGMNANTPDPAQGTGHPVFYLKLCLDADSLFWRSDTFRVQSGYNVIDFGTGPGQIDFTCIPGVCGGCPSPQPVTNLTASTTECDSILLDWTHDGANVAGYRVVINQDIPNAIYVPGAGNTAYTAQGLPGGVDHSFRVRAYRICGTGQDADTAYSPATEVMGRSRTLPPTPTSLAASDTICGSVRVTWTMATTLGLDSFRIYRDDVWIGSIVRGNSGQTHTFNDNAPLAGVHEYCVFGYSVICGEGDPSCDNGTAGAVPTCTVSNVAATNNDCDEVCVTWTATCTDADSFRVLRSNVLVGTVAAAGGPNYSFCHAPTAGQTGQYQVQPKNACGNGAAQPTTPVPGMRLAAPGGVAGVTSSDTLCDRVRVIWTDLAEATVGYTIRRNNDSLTTVAENVNSYDDLTAVTGVTYTYRVIGRNACGAGAAGNGEPGTRRAPGTGTATFTLVTAGPPNWTYSMDVNTGCLNTVVIRDFCEGTTATAPTGWTVEVDDDSIIFSTTTPVGAQDAVVTGFVLSHPTCDGDGRWNIGQSGGSIRGPLPVGDNAALPTEFSVKVFPNPFNPVTNFKIAVPQASETRILVYNVAGQLVREMNLGRLQAGYHSVPFGGSELTSGMYFARVQSGDFHSTHKLMLLK